MFYVLFIILWLLIILQLKFSVFKYINDKHLLLILISLLLIKEFNHPVKKEYASSNNVFVDGSAVSIDTDAFEHLNTLVKALAADDTITIPGNVIIEGKLTVNGDKTTLTKPDIVFQKHGNDAQLKSSKKLHISVDGVSQGRTYIQHLDTDKVWTGELRGSNAQGDINMYGAYLRRNAYWEDDVNQKRHMNRVRDHRIVID